MIKSVMCLAKGHSVNRNRVWHDGRNYRTSCVRCSMELLRDREGWRQFNESEDGADNRLPHPRKRELA